MIHDLKESPSIYVIIKNPVEPLLREVLAGIEEEGIPYKIDESSYEGVSEEDDVYNSSVKSRLGIGIGLFKNRVILHYDKLRVNEPIFDINLKSNDKNKARAIGCNAARLYKQVPFKTLESIEENNEILDDISIDDLKEKILKILKSKMN